MTDAGSACVLRRALSLLHPRHLFSSDQPISYNLFSAPILLLLPASSPHVDACLSILLWLASQQSLDWFKPHSLFQLFTLVLCCPFPPKDHPGLFQEHLLHILWADHSHVHRHLLVKQQVAPLYPLNTKITGFEKKQILQGLAPASMSAPRRSAFSTLSGALSAIISRHTFRPNDCRHGGPQ